MRNKKQTNKQTTSQQNKYENITKPPTSVTSQTKSNGTPFKQKPKENEKRKKKKENDSIIPKSSLIMVNYHIVLDGYIPPGNIKKVGFQQSNATSHPENTGPSDDRHFPFGLHSWVVA